MQRAVSVAARAPQLAQLRRCARACATAAPQAPPPLWAQPGGKVLHRRRLSDRSEEGYSRLRAKTPLDCLHTEPSACGNGTVRVFACGPWRALCFDASEQGLSYCGEAGRDAGYNDGAALPTVLAFEYTRTMAAAAAGFARLQRPAGGSSGRVLCVGLGSGTLPAFLAHHSPATRVQVVELDPVVVRVVDEVLRVPFHRAASLAAATCAPRGRFELLQAEGGAALEELAAAVRRGEQEGVSSLFLDAFDAAAEVPSHMRAPPFLAAAWGCLAPDGLLIVNLFNGAPGSAIRKAMGRYAASLRAALPGAALFSLKILRQQANVVLVAARPESALGRAAAAGKPPLRVELEEAARAVALEQGWEFDAGELVQRMFVVRPDGAAEQGALLEAVPGRVLDLWRESSAADPDQYFA